MWTRQTIANSEISNGPIESWSKSHVISLVIISLVGGIYFAYNTVLIAKDGMVYIEIAKDMECDTLEAIRQTKHAPGYPFLICLMHRFVNMCFYSSLLENWILSAQLVSCLSRLTALLVLYFVGGRLVGFRFSFFGVLILCFLPDSVDFGTDALSDWTNLMFLSVGFLLLLLSAEYRKSWMWGLAGVVAGLGYLVRPECVQLVVYGSILLLFEIVWTQPEIKKGSLFVFLILLLASFMAVTLPYMLIKGYVFPDQHLFKMPILLSKSSGSLYMAGFSTSSIYGYQKMIANICETLIYYFLPALGIGLWYYFQKYTRKSYQTFFVTAFIAANILMVLFVLSCRGYLSRRHTLPLVAFTIFFIPVGFQMIGDWLSRQNIWPKLDSQEKGRRWFLILISVGLIICGIKLVRMAPLRWEKQGYRDAAIWLNQNTEPNVVIAVPDRRIAFYAERQGVEYDSEIPKKYAYIVAVMGRKGNGSVFDREVKEVYSTEMNRKKKDQKVVIYQAVSQPSE